ncbi:MAG TPA: NAD(P)/FAD-dependent oxidoreductase [Actinomycetota bacterium]|nr:NAD(P)/FAD-dependent oxidoreductase [Actinomycetota bacterium]
MPQNTDWDCIVVGGGAAGLSAALVLGRARLNVLLIDSGGQSNLPAHGIGGLLGHDGRPPSELYALGRKELAGYPTVELCDGRVVSGERDGDRFLLSLQDGSTEAARRVLLATGMDYSYPDVPGIAPMWGHSVFHCPFCHGWEARDQALGVLDGSPNGVHRALLLKMWSDDVTLLANGPAQFDGAEAKKLSKAGVAIDVRRVLRVRGEGDRLSAVEFEDGTSRPLGGLLVPVTLRQRSALAEQLGATYAEAGPVVANAVQVDPMFRTQVPGLSAAGDASVQMPSVANAVAAGSNAAAAIVQSLVVERYE